MHNLYCPDLFISERSGYWKLINRFRSVKRLTFLGKKVRESTMEKISLLSASSIKVVFFIAAKLVTICISSFSGDGIN
jgi:hypothetical protein